MAQSSHTRTTADDDREDRNWFTALMEYTIRRESDDVAVESSELETLISAFRQERAHNLKEIAANFPEITTESVAQLERQVSDVYPQAHELWSVLKQKRHYLENSLIKKAEEYSQHLQDLRENSAVVEATIEIFDKLKNVHATFDDAKSALDADEFRRCALLLESVDNKITGFSDDDNENIVFLSEIRRDLQRTRRHLLQKIEKAWKTTLQFSFSSTGRSSRDRIEIRLDNQALFADIVIAALQLKMLDRLVRNTAQEVLNNVVTRLFDSESSAVLKEDKRSIKPNSSELLILFPADGTKTDARSRACDAFETLYIVVDRLLGFCLLNSRKPAVHDSSERDAAADHVFRKVLSDALAVPLMQELVVEKCLQAFSTTAGGGTNAAQQRMQRALTNLYDLFVRFNIACGSAPDLSIATNLINQSVIDTACADFVQRAHRIVRDTTLFSNGKTVRIALDDADTSTLVDQMLATVQLVVSHMRESSALPGVTPSIHGSSSKRSRLHGNAPSSTATAGSELQLQTSAALQELSTVVDDILAACSQAKSPHAVNLYVRSIFDVYNAYLELSPDLTSNSTRSTGNQSVAVLTFCSCSFYPQIIAETKSKIEEVLRWNESIVLADDAIGDDSWSGFFDDRSRLELLPKASTSAESFVRLVLQRQVDAVNRILTNVGQIGRSSNAAMLSGDAGGIAAAKLMKAATWLKQQPAAAALSTAASSLATSSGSTALEMRALIDGAALVRVYDHIEALKIEWFVIMPPRAALAMLSAVVDIVLEKLGSIVFRQNDIAADDATALAQNFKLLARKLMLLYKSLLGGEAPTRHSTRWDWFNELTFVLEASMSDIDNRWSDGQGPLALHFGPSHVMLLVRVLFENNDRRQRLLDKLEYAAATES